MRAKRTLYGNIFTIYVTRIILRPLSALSLDEGLSAPNGKTPSAACCLVQKTKSNVRY